MAAASASSSAAAAPSSADPAFVLVCSLDSLKASKRELLRFPNGRGIVLIHHADATYALDHACYHHGGPLAEGDIEEMGGAACVSCPWHRYKITLGTGECLYVGIDIATRQQAVRSKGVKQRTHPVRVVGEDGATVHAGAPALLAPTLAGAETSLPLPAPGAAPGVYVLDMSSLTSSAQATALGPDVAFHWSLHHSVATGGGSASGETHATGPARLESDGYACIAFGAEEEDIRMGRAEPRGALPPSGQVLLHSRMPGAGGESRHYPSLSSS